MKLVGRLEMGAASNVPSRRNLGNGAHCLRLAEACAIPAFVDARRIARPCLPF